MKKVSEHAGHCGVKLGIEFLNRFETYFGKLNDMPPIAAAQIDHPTATLILERPHDLMEAGERLSKNLAFISVYRFPGVSF